MGLQEVQATASYHHMVGLVLPMISKECLYLLFEPCGPWTVTQSLLFSTFIYSFSFLFLFLFFSHCIILILRPFISTSFRYCLGTLSPLFVYQPFNQDSFSRIVPSLWKLC